MMIFFFSYPKFFLSGICSSASFEGRISFPETFANLIVAIFFLSRCCICIFLFFRLRMRSHPVTHTPSHARSQAHNNSSVHSLAHATHAQPDSWPRPPGGEDGALSGRLVGGDEPGSWESRHSYTMGPFTHMSDSVADWGRGTLVAPSLVGGPQNCDGFVVHLSS